MPHVSLIAIKYSKYVANSTYSSIETNEMHSYEPTYIYIYIYTIDTKTTKTTVSFLGAHLVKIDRNWKNTETHTENIMILLCVCVSISLEH